ncbi:MAG TPA: hypothetical protein VGI70_10800, partial [Polyangiales bacterium]
MRALDRRSIFEYARSQPSQVGRTQRSRFDVARAIGLNAQKIALELHEELVLRGATIDAQA